MTFYDTHRKLYTHIGYFADRGTPPDKSALFWAIDTGKMYCVNDAMNWVEVNPDFPATPGMFHVKKAAVATSIYPSAPLFIIPSFGAFIPKIDFAIEEAYDVGIQLTVGDAGDVDRLFTTSDLDPQTVGTYTVYPNYQYSFGSTITIYINTPATVGFGTMYIHYDEAPT